MAQRRHHAERAFERLLRTRRIPYVAVNEARQALLPGGPGPGDAGGLKNFDFIVYGRSENLLVEIKGRTIPAPACRGVGGRPPRPRLESWVTLDDVDALGRWQTLFGPGYRAVFVFVYAWPGAEPPPDGLFAEVVGLDGAWHALRAVTLDDYRPRMRTRSPRWRTVQLPREDFDRLARPFLLGAPDDRPALEPLPA